MTTPKLSVALPVHNGANYLREALDSVLSQSFADFELTVSDNCSSDETPTILAEYAARDRRVRVHRSEIFLPQADNVNRSIELSSSEWVKLLCHDDLLHPDCLSAIAGALSTQQTDRIGVVGNGEEWLFANGFRHTSVPRATTHGTDTWQGRQFIRMLIKGTAPVGLPAITTATVRKRAWQSCGGFDRRFVHFDVFLWTRLLMLWDYLFVFSPLTVNRIHGGQVAVSARTSLRSVYDHKLFWDEFVEQGRVGLELDRASVLKARLKPVSFAATTILIELLKRRYSVAARMCLQLPVTWWPLLPFFLFRNFLMERRRILRIRPRVPISLIYP